MTDLPAHSSTAWWRTLSREQWIVFLLASAAWFFDCLDQRIFSLARTPALISLMPTNASHGAVQAMGKNVTALFLLGWGVGGFLFGAFGDRYGRARMLKTTIIFYSAFTGLTFFSRSHFDFAVFRFLTGVGIGGVFGLAVAIVAESVPDAARTGALAMLQILSAIGNITAALLKSLFDELQRSGLVSDAWRWMFLLGGVPALMVIFAGKHLRESDSWQQLAREGKLIKGSIFAPYFELLADRRWRRNLSVGAILASTGVIGLWAIGEYAVDFQRIVFAQHFAESGLAAPEVETNVNRAIAIAYILNMLGAASGMWAFAKLANSIGRKPAFALGFALALLVTLFVFGTMRSPIDAYWMMPLMGAAQLSVFAGFAIYLPELFPGAMRATGVSFCYNFGRFAAAAGSLVSARLAMDIFGQFGSPLMERYSAMAMCSIFVVGILVIPFCPETRGRTLPS